MWDHPLYGYGDTIWRILLPQKVPFAEPERATNHLLAFGTLLHVIAKGYLKSSFFLAREWREYLHPALREVHAHGGCSDENCRWASHDYGSHHHTKCPLLVETPLEVEVRSSTASHTKPSSPIGRVSGSRLDDILEEGEGTYSVSYLDPVTVYTESRSKQQTEPQSAHSQSPGGNTQHGKPAGIKHRRGSGDLRPPARYH